MRLFEFGEIRDGVKLHSVPDFTSLSLLLPRTESIVQTDDLVRMAGLAIRFAALVFGRFGADSRQLVRTLSVFVQLN